MEDPAQWSAHPADGVELALQEQSGALRLDFRFSAGGYAIARREVDLELPENYAFRFRLRGDAPVNDLEFKLVDASGENVWWHVKRNLEWPTTWETVRIKKRQIKFAWGPAGGGELTHVAAIEFAITAGSGGEGTVWIDDLELIELPVESGPPPVPVARASSFAPGYEAARALDGDPGTSWRPASDDLQPWFELDLRGAREFGALTLDWEADRGASRYTVDGFLEGKSQRLVSVQGGNGGVDDLYLPESEAEVLRVAIPATVGLAEIRLQPLEYAATREAFFMNLARRAERGLYPRGFLDEPTAWTVVGVDGDTREGLLGADGALEAGPGGFTIEPFLESGDRLLTWNDAVKTTRLVDGDLPLPVVTWNVDPWNLEVQATGVGKPGSSSVMGSYIVRNTGQDPLQGMLWLTIRPFQVNPPVQFLNVLGGTSKIATIARDGDLVLVNGKPGVVAMDRPDAWGASTYAGGSIVGHLVRGDLPERSAVDDPFEAASAAMGYRLALEPGQSRRIEIVLPLHENAPDAESIDGIAAQRAARDYWRTKADRVTIEGPPAARQAIETLKAQLGWILVNRAAAGIQPGTRSYARSWIRDGTLTSVALLRLGCFEEARDFLLWYAPHQYENGKIPCVVDWRGADPVPEHDSTGQFIYLVREYLRYTGDLAVAEQMWPRVVRGVEYLESLLAQRRSAGYATPDQRRFYGILPPSISHEGYAAKPMHSYWDDFFALRGFKDAVQLAERLGKPTAGLMAIRDRFAADLSASLEASLMFHDIDYVPGCADLGDFDATSTTVALDPAAAGNLLPEGSLQATFERYWEFFAGRRDGDPWRAFTPYEIRTIGTFVRLGWRERAYEALEFFLAHRVPSGWRQWPEVVASDTTRAWFVGDMPHTWVGSDYVRSFLDLLVYEDRDAGDTATALVLAAGLPAAWLEGEGFRVDGLPTPWGTLGYRIWKCPEGVRMQIDAGVQPPGGLRIDAPIRPVGVLLNGKPASLDDAGRIRVDRVPAQLLWPSR